MVALYFNESPQYCSQRPHRSSPLANRERKCARMLITVKNKSIVSFIIIFGTLSFPIRLRISTAGRSGHREMPAPNSALVAGLHTLPPEAQCVVSLPRESKRCFDRSIRFGTTRGSACIYGVYCISSLLPPLPPPVGWCGYYTL